MGAWQHVLVCVSVGVVSLWVPGNALCGPGLRVCAWLCFGCGVSVWPLAVVLACGGTCLSDFLLVIVTGVVGPTAMHEVAACACSHSRTRRCGFYSVVKSEVSLSCSVITGHM